MPARTHVPDDMRMQGCEQSIWIWRYEDARMQGYKQAYTNIRIWGCEEVTIQASAQEPNDMRMWGYDDINQ